MPGILDSVIDEAVLDACIEFCNTTLIVKAGLDPIQTQPNVREYELDAPSQQTIARILRVWADGNEMKPLQEDDAATEFFVDNGSRSLPKAFIEAQPGVLTVAPGPDKVYTITCRVALKPSRSATQVADILFEDWTEVIVHGALFRLLSQPDGDGAKPLNGSLAADHLRMFKAGMNAAMLQAQLGNARGELYIRPPRIK